MKNIYNRILAFYNTIEGKIAFYPTLLAFIGVNFAFAMAALEDRGVSNYLLDYFPQLILQDGDTALTIISTCIGGLISMMVFSFSMVMLLLSQASSNFSPRLLPGLISDRKNQVILGTYLATILYMIFILFSIEPEDKKYTLPGLSIIIGIVLTVVCLAAFIYFIHNMSQSIQISNIIDKIYIQSKKRLQENIDQETQNDPELSKNFPDTSGWHSYKSSKSGYFQNISLKNIAEICDEHDTRIHLTVPKGFFILSDANFITSEKELDELTVEKITSNISFSKDELVRDNYILAFKQITEIAVKQCHQESTTQETCINAIDYLTELFALRMKKNNTGVLVNDGKAQIKISIVTFEELAYNVMASLRTYCKHDPIIVQKLIWMLSYLKEQVAEDTSYNEVIIRELGVLLKESKVAFDTNIDIEKVADMAEKV